MSADRLQATDPELDFSTLERVELLVPIMGEQYVLCEADGPAARKYRAAGLKGSEMIVDDDAGTRSFKNVEGVVDVEALLISLCLFRVSTVDGKRYPVPQPVIDAWPSRVQKALFNKIKEISDLNEKADLDSLRKQRDRLNRKIAKLEREHYDEENEKNSPSATPVTSA